jgi:hypothetical protein
LTRDYDRCIIRNDMMAPRPARFGVSARLGTYAAVGVGLLLVLAATVGPAPSPTHDPGARVTVRLPDPVQALVLGLLALSTIILLSMQRRRPRTDEAGPSGEDPRVSPWLTALHSLLPVLVLALGCYLVWRHFAGEEGQQIEKAFAGLLDLLALADKPAISMPSFDLAIAGLLVALAVGIFGMMALVALAERLEAWRARPGVVRSPGAGGVDEPRDDLRAEPDARRAVIRAYGRFERALAAARAPRAAWQTPAEFMRSTLARVLVPAPPVARLTGLFEIARFSAHPLGAEAREAACDCLDEITSALDEDAARAP